VLGIGAAYDPKNLDVCVVKIKVAPYAVGIDVKKTR
jgi:hypothetical protein